MKKRIVENKALTALYKTLNSRGSWWQADF